MPNPIESKEKKDGIYINALRGEGMALLAFDLEESLVTRDLLGFAVECCPPGEKPYFLLNRLSFDSPVYTGKREWTPSNLAPFQKFRWLHVPSELNAGTYTYQVTAMYLNGAKSGSLKAGPSARATVDLSPQTFQDLNIGFTRGYLSSQAYAERFGNGPIRPAGKKTVDYKTEDFKDKYEWLGFEARRMAFQFLEECRSDPKATLDVFAYDLDEPDIIRALIGFGRKARFFLDDASLHTKPGAVEIEAKRLLEKSAGKDNVVTGHFQRFAHSKVFIKKIEGIAVRVLTGSANFSVRGLYVQANSVITIDNSEVTALYETAFEQAFNDMKGFRKCSLAATWHEPLQKGLPGLGICFSPHIDSSVSLEKVAEAIKCAQSSVLFAVMELGGSGPVLDELKALPEKGQVFSYGVTQTAAGLKLFKPGDAKGIFTSFSFLEDNVPAPFKKEWRGGAGQVIHHKFVVVDFNGKNPVVFTGSSNLAAGGEKQNGDNLLAISDGRAATSYAVEAVRLVDHYHFRAALKGTSKSNPLYLKKDTQSPWWMTYYRNDDVKCQDRLLFAK